MYRHGLWSTIKRVRQFPPLRPRYRARNAWKTSNDYFAAGVTYAVSNSDLLFLHVVGASFPIILSLSAEKSTFPPELEL